MMNLNSNNLIFSGNNKEFESVFILRKIKRIVSKYYLPIHIIEIDCLSKKSIRLSMDYNVNSVPYAIYMERVFVYNTDIKEKDVDKEILNFLKT